MELQKIFIIFFFFISLTSATSVIDFCVADVNFPIGPAGYPCKNPTNLTVDDFVYSGLNAATNVLSIYKATLSFAVDHTFPALNGLGLSMARVDIDVGGVVPLHSHRGSELMFVVEGTVIAGFIGSNNQAYYKTLNKGDSMVTPQASYHFVVNIGKSPVVVISGFDSANPGLRITTPSIVANNLPIDVIQKITFLDDTQIRKLKKIFGGSHYY